MRSVSARRLTATVASATALFALCCGGIAYAIISPTFQYTSPQTTYLSLNPMAFSPKGKSDAAHFQISPPFWIEKDVGALSVCMEAGVNLPDGARITSLTAWGSTGTDQAIQVRLQRANLATGAANGVVGLVSHNTSQSRFSMSSSASGAAAVVNNQHFSYGLEACLVDSTVNSLFYGARITYTYTTAGG